MIDNNPEYSLLVESLNSILEGSDDNKRLWAIDLTQFGEDHWVRFSNLVLAEGVTALVAESLPNQTADFPDDLADAFSQFHQNQRASNDTRTNRFVTVLSALQVAGIITIPFKGPKLAESVFHDIGLRSFWDFDFLFPASQIKQLSESLESQGFEGILPKTPKQVQAYWKYSGQAVYRRESDELALEPHWSFCSSVMACDFDYDAIWARSKLEEWHGVQIRTLSPEDEFIMLALHGGKEAWFKLKYVIDFARFLKMNPDLDWVYISSVAEKMGIARIVAIAVEIVSATFDAFKTYNCPFKNSDKVAKELVLKIQQSKVTLAPEMYYFNSYFMAIRERHTDKLVYLLRLFATPRNNHFSIIRLPDSLFFLYTPFKIVYDGIILPVWILWKSVFGQKPTKSPS